MSTHVELPKGQIVREDRKLVCEKHIVNGVKYIHSKWCGAVVFFIEDAFITPHCEFCGDEATYNVASYEAQEED